MTVVPWVEYGFAMVKRTTVADVSNVLRAMVRREAEQAAGSNKVLSRTEQAKVSPALKAAAEAVRAKGGPNARVTIDALEKQVSEDALRLIGTVNKPGPGGALLSKAEATAAFKSDPAMGKPVLQAYEIASGHGIDTDSIIRERVTRDMDPAESSFKVFASLTEAENYRNPDDLHTSWYVVTQDSLLSRSYTVGRDDLWSQKLEVDKVTGAIAVLGEH